MKSFWGMYGSSEIIVMAQEEAIRAAVRAEASDYITCPWMQMRPNTWTEASMNA